MRRFGPGSIIAVLCTAILFVVCTSPNREHVNAQVQQTKQEIAALENLKEGLTQFVLEQNALNASVQEFNKEVVEKITALNTSVKDTQDVVKLTSLSMLEDNCTCGEKLADLQKQIDELKTKIASLEQVKPTVSTAAAASSYGTATPARPASTGGSTGSSTNVSAAGGGSTGSVKPGGAGGSSGSIARSQVSSTATWFNASSASATSQSPHICVVSTPACTRCPAVIAQVQREYPPAGWTVEIESEAPAQGQSYPYYRICVGSQCAEIHCDVSQLNDAVKSQLTQWGVTFGDSLPTTSASSFSVPAGAAAPDKRGLLQRLPVRSAFEAATAPIRAAGNVLSEWGTGRALEVARASAQYRAANRIKGHSQVDLQSGMSNGVGWSTSNPQPQTCFWNRRSQGAYASVQGTDGTYYSTLVLY